MSRETSLAKAFYKIGDSISNRNWNEFARLYLEIPDGEIENVEIDYSNDIKERKYQMCKIWQNRKGNEATVTNIFDLLSRFRNRDEETGTSQDSSKQSEIVIICDQTVTTTGENTKVLLEEDGFKVYLHNKGSCLDDKAEKAKYKIILMTNKLETDLSHLSTSFELKTTLLITRANRKSKIPDQMSKFTTKTSKGKTTANFYANTIREFIQNSTKSASSGESDSNTINDPSEEELHPTYPRIDPARFTEFSREFKQLKILKKPFDRKYCYVLITSSFENNADLKTLAEIPWMQVFDFDPKSEIKGFLSKVESALKSRRHYTVDDSQSAVLDENVTNWIFINGHCNIANADIPAEYEINAKIMKLHCDSLATYCQGRKVPFVLVLWYPRKSNSDNNFEEFISFLKTYMQASVECFNCVICVGIKPNDKAPFGRMLTRLKLKNVIVVPLDLICAWLSENNGRSCGVKGAVSIKRTIPKFSEKEKTKESFDIQQRKYNWLNVCLDVLLINGIRTEREENLNERGEDYLKGGKLSWEVIASGCYDAARDLLAEKRRVIQKQFIETGKSGIIPIYHQPGSGGTTFARRLLWELKKDAPCLELKATEFPIEEVKERLTFIRNETHLPIILLIDGNSTHDAKTLLEFCRYERLVILHVQRVYSLSPGDGNKKTGEIWLPEVLSLSEAKLLSDVFSRAKPQSKRRLMTLTDEIEFGKDHAMFEYGLTAYESDFRGVRRYVHGNLRINGRSKKLEGWQLVLAYLSLANYYGHCGLPCKLCGALLGKKSEDIVEIEDLPHSGQKFITEDENGEWNISYYTVAKEILEQVLVKRDSTDYESEGNYLSEKACQALSKLAIDFIDFIKDNLSDPNNMPIYFKDILTWIFIIRNYKNTTEKDESVSKLKHSRLVEDTRQQDEKRRILEKLVKCFPNDADFHAHLGRFYARTQMPNEAGESFKKAIQVRLRDVSKYSQKRGDAGLCRFHHMYGHHLSRLIRFEIKEYLENSDQHWRIARILEYAGQAVTQFSNSVKYYQKGVSASYIYLGEIEVRIEIAELYHKIKGGQIQTTLEKNLNEFVMRSFSRCDHLISECFYYSANDDIPQNDIEMCINKFIAFFHGTEQALKKWAGNDEGIHSKRCHISIMKMKTANRKDKKKSFVYNLNREEVETFISLCEGIFEDAKREVNREYHISYDMLEWLQAIRHPLSTKKYALTEVQQMVLKWDCRKERGSLSTYYHYVLTTLVAICGPSSQVCNAYSEKSSKLRDELTREPMIPRFLMDRCFEWLAICEQGHYFSNSIHYSSLGDWGSKFWKSTEKVALLRVCSGTVKQCKIHQGHIVMDGRHKPEIHVFFNPQRYGFYTYEGKQKQRVEFYLGFNPKHGAEAYQVRKLDKKECNVCETSVEIPKLGKDNSTLKAECPSCKNTITYSI